MTVEVNRAPVLTLWAAVVAEREGQDRDAALTLGEAVAGINAQAKGQMLGIYTPRAPDREHIGRKEPGEGHHVQVCGRSVRTMDAPAGLRAMSRDEPIRPESVQRYLEKAFGQALGPARDAMEHLAAAYAPDRIEEKAWGLYERFRPVIAPGTSGWGQKGKLDLDLIRKLAAGGA